MPTRWRRRQDAAASQSRTLLKTARVAACEFITPLWREGTTREEKLQPTGKALLLFCWVSYLGFFPINNSFRVAASVYFYADGKLEESRRSRTFIMNDFLPARRPNAGKTRNRTRNDSSNLLLAVRLQLHRTRCSDVQLAFRTALRALIHHKNTQCTSRGQTAARGPSVVSSTFHPARPI